MRRCQVYLSYLSLLNSISCSTGPLITLLLGSWRGMGIKSNYAYNKQGQLPGYLTGLPEVNESKQKCSTTIKGCNSQREEWSAVWLTSRPSKNSFSFQFIQPQKSTKETCVQANDKSNLKRQKHSLQAAALIPVSRLRRIIN